MSTHFGRRGSSGSRSADADRNAGAGVAAYRSCASRGAKRYARRRRTRACAAASSERFGGRQLTSRSVWSVSTDPGTKRGPRRAEFDRGTRRVPIAAVLRDNLLEHRMTDELDGLVLERSFEAPCNPTTVAQPARRGWKKAKLQHVTLHDCRHSLATAFVRMRKPAPAGCPSPPARALPPEAAEPRATLLRKPARLLRLDRRIEQ
jgi:hypothetical protein